MTKLCLTRRCGLCHFELREGDDLIAVLRNGKKSRPFQYRFRAKVKDQIGFIFCDACDSPCIHANDQAIGCHLFCVDLLRAIYPSTQALMSATPDGDQLSNVPVVSISVQVIDRQHSWYTTPTPLDRFLKLSDYSFEPSPRQERDRCQWLGDRLASGLEMALPLELRREVLRYLPREYAVMLREYAVMINTPLLESPKAFQSSFTVAAPLIRHYVRFEGEKYLSSLTNKLERSDAWLTPKVIYVSEDHRGIKSMMISGSEVAPEVDCVPGVWWKALPILNSDGVVEFHGDVKSSPSPFELHEYVAEQRKQGVKLRYLTCSDGSRTSTTLNSHSFAIPQHPQKLFRIQEFYKVQRRLPLRMSLFRYNCPQITGYSVCCNPAPIALHAHTPNDDLSFYQSTPADSVWVHVPLEEDEHITSIWMRARLRMNRELALAFETDKGRVQLLGAQTTPALSACPWILLAVPSGKPGYFFFDTHTSSISRLGFDFEPPSQTTTLVAPEPLSPHPDLRSCEGFLWSQASVENVVAVSPCRRRAGDATEIIGLLLHYSDGTKACVGQVRLDCLDPTLTVEPFQKLYLGFEIAEAKGPYIARIEMSAAWESTVSMWFEVSWSGALEWWYSYRQCQIWQNGRRSMPTRS